MQADMVVGTNHRDRGANDFLGSVQGPNAECLVLGMLGLKQTNAQALNSYSEPFSLNSARAKHH
jgi:hypothetical protein